MLSVRNVTSPRMHPPAQPSNLLSAAPQSAPMQPTQKRRNASRELPPFALHPTRTWSEGAAVYNLKTRTQAVTGLQVQAVQVLPVLWTYTGLLQYRPCFVHDFNLYIYLYDSETCHGKVVHGSVLLSCTT